MLLALTRTPPSITEHVSTAAAKDTRPATHIAWNQESTRMHLRGTREMIRMECWDTGATRGVEPDVRALINVKEMEAE